MKYENRRFDLKTIDVIFTTQITTLVVINIEDIQLLPSYCNEEQKRRLNRVRISGTGLQEQAKASSGVKC